MEKETEYIEIRGAKSHNLKNVSLSIPRNEFVVITGLSGSGKSSLAFDTIYAEGQRRYMDTLSAYAKQFMGILEKPEVESITGLSPIIAIEQKTTGNNPRSTVGTITEIYDFLRHFDLDGELLEDSEYTTVAGLILDELDHVPVAGEKVDWENFSFEVVDMDGARIDKVIVKLIKPEDSDSAPAGN